MAGAEDLRALFEAIAHGSDAKLTATERLRAAELLMKLDEREPVRRDFREELAHMSDEELERHGDAMADPDPEEVAALVSGTSMRQPRLAAAIHAEVERRMRELAEGDAGES